MRTAGDWWLIEEMVCRVCCKQLVATWTRQNLWRIPVAYPRTRRRGISLVRMSECRDRRESGDWRDDRGAGHFKFKFIFLIIIESNRVVIRDRVSLPSNLLTDNLTDHLRITTAHSGPDGFLSEISFLPAQIQHVDMRSRGAFRTFSHHGRVSQLFSELRHEAREEASRWIRRSG